MRGPTTFTLARFERSRVPGLLATVPIERIRLRRLQGMAWGRHLGCSAQGLTSGVDPARWAWLCSWDDEVAAGRFHRDLEVRLRPIEAVTLSLQTLRARGRWAGHELAGPPHRTADAASEAPDEPAATDGPAPLVVLTRARVRATRWRPFTGAIPPVDADLSKAAGLLGSVGVGEWPVLVQATVSVWADAPAMTAFAQTAAHQTAVRRSGAEDWYAEELFARFSVQRSEGTWDGSPIPAALGPSGPSERGTLGPSGPSERGTLGPSGPSERGTSGPAERGEQ